ncbi:MAG: L,D-transpeptidase [Hyphomicrobiales bacterium]|nr:L,D-transpeptidase [Hyphomicrobiales bacterium]
MPIRLFACLIASASLVAAATAVAAPAGKSRNFDHTVQTTDPIGRFFGFSTSPVPRSTVSYPSNHRPGTIVINTRERRLYLLLGNGQALRYGIGVGRDGMTWAGVTRISAKREWPDWTPPEQMLRRQPGLPRYMPGGPDNPLGARALYLGSSLYRIHGSNEPETIGQAVSSGCFRLTNEDVIDLYNRVAVGATVVVQR